MVTPTPKPLKVANSPPKSDVRWHRTMKVHATTVLLIGNIVAPATSFNYLRVSSRKRALNYPLYGRPSTHESSSIKKVPTEADALALLNEAKLLRAQASELQQQLNEEKEERIRKERERIDSLIDALLFHGTTNNNDESNASSLSSSIQAAQQQPRSQQQLVNTEAKVAELLIQKRLNYDMVNQMFDRICELSNRPQSIDSCSPLLSLLLDAACKVDCLEKEDNPNKRWNHRVERDLRRKLFALGYGIRIEDVEKKERVRSITGEKDCY